MPDYTARELAPGKTPEPKPAEHDNHDMNMGGDGLPSLGPPQITEPKAYEEQLQPKREVEVMTNDGQIIVKAYGRQWSTDSAGLKELTERVRSERQDDGKADMAVDLRVDKALPYSRVQSVMQALTNAEVERINLVVRQPSQPRGEATAEDAP